MSSRLAQLVDVVPDARPGLRVEADRRLVEEQHPRRVHQAAGDLEAPPHPAGERLHPVGPALPEPDHLEHLAHPVGHPRLGHAVQLGVEAQVLLGGEVGVEGRVLEHQPDVAADVGALADDVVAGDAGRAGGRLGQRAQHLDRGRLAGAVGPEEPEDLAGLDLERDLVDRGQRRRSA